MIPSVFNTPGLFRLNLVVVDIPTDRFVIDDRGNKDYLCRKVAFYLQLDPVRRQGLEGGDGAISTDQQTYDATVVGTEDLNLDGVESWRSHDLPTGLKMGTRIDATINGDRGTLTFNKDNSESCLAASQAGFGSRLQVTFTKTSRAGNGGI